MTNLDLEREQRSRTEIRQAFREIFPLAWEGDLPAKPSEIRDFLRRRVEHEVQEGTNHFVTRVTRILCEVTRPKTHIEDMVRIVVEEVKQSRTDREKLAKAVEVTTERDELLARIREIGRIVVCGHTEDSDGRARLVQCVRDAVEGVQHS